MWCFRQLVGFKGAVVGAIVVVFAVCDASSRSDRPGREQFPWCTDHWCTHTAAPRRKSFASPKIARRRHGKSCTPHPSSGLPIRRGAATCTATVPAATPQASTGDTKPGSALLTPALEPPLQKVPAPTAPADVSSPSPPASNNFANVPNKHVGVHQTQQDSKRFRAG